MRCQYIFIFSLLFFFGFDPKMKAQTASEGIVFIQNDYQEALRRAKAEGKPIFMDAYTTWCGPCKKMAKETFTDDSVAQHFNARYVNLKMDMERGDGVALAQQFAVMAYPTLLFLDADGKILHKAIGFHGVDDLFSLSQVASNSDDNLANWHKRYENGDTTAEFLREYTAKLAEMMEPNRFAVVEKYLSYQKDWLAEENADFILENLPSSLKNTEGVSFKLFKFLLENRIAFEKRIKKELLDNQIQDILAASIYNEKKIPTLGFADTLIALIYAGKKRETKQNQANYRLEYYRMQGDRPNYAKSAVKYFKKYDDFNALTDVSQTFYEQIDDKKMLKRATKWVKRIIKSENIYPNHLLLANLYQKLGDTEGALAAANVAVSLAEQSKEDDSDAKKLIEKLTTKSN